MTAAAAWTAAAVAALLVAETRNARAGVWLAKPLASAGFVAAALAAGALRTTYGQWVLAGLVLSWLGDVLLIPRERPAVFRAGILSFLSGHVAFVVAFAARGVSLAPAAGAALATVAAAIAVVRWLRPHLPAGLRAAAYAYVIVISAMVAFAAGTYGFEPNGALLVGALAFYASDLSVARDRFVASELVNRLWGLPLYYGAQLLLAYSTSSG